MDTIREVGPGKHFLGCNHTQQNFENAFYRSPLMHNNSVEQWEAEGAKDMAQRANTRWKAMLAEYEAMLDRMNRQRASFAELNVWHAGPQRRMSVCCCIESNGVRAAPSSCRTPQRSTMIVTFAQGVSNFGGYFSGNTIRSHSGWWRMLSISAFLNAGSLALDFQRGISALRTAGSALSHASMAA